MIGKDIWRTTQHILRDKNIIISLEQYNRYYQFANEELKRTVYGRIGEKDGYETEQQITDALLPFKAQSTIALTTGLGTMPTDYWHKSRIEITSTGIEVKFVDAKECIRRRNNSITQPSINHPIVELKDGTFQVYPTSVSSVTFVYLKKGNTPQVVLKTENGIQVYDTVNSVEPEWGDDRFIDLVRLMVGYLSVPLTNSEILAYNEQKIDKEN